MVYVVPGKRGHSGRGRAPFAGAFPVLRRHGFAPRALRSGRGVGRRLFFKRRWWRRSSPRDELREVLDDPFDDFTPGELHGLGHGGGEVNVPLCAFCSFDELYFSGVTYSAISSVSLVI